MELNLNGSNATIEGQNGSGKTSIVDAVCWLMNGKFSDGKTGESSNLRECGKVTAVELETDSGLKLRRECNGKSLYFVQGIPCNATDYKVQVAAIFKESVAALLTPFNFSRLHYSERRGILLKLFAQNVAVESSDFAEIACELEKFTPEQIIKASTYRRKELEKTLATIPARIEELQKNLSEVDVSEVNAQIDNLMAKIASKLDEVKTCQSGSQKNLEPSNQAATLEKEASAIEEKISVLREEYLGQSRKQYECELKLQELRQEYGKVKAASTGVCPTCGSRVPAEKLGGIQSRLDEIVTQGKNLSVEIEGVKQKQELLKQAAEVAKAKAADLRARAAELKKQGVDNSAALERLQAVILERDELQEKLSQLRIQLLEAERSEENKRRIEELKAQEVATSAEMASCDKKIYLAGEYIRRKITALESSVNAHFEFVKFKMFENFKVAEGVKEICEPYLNGVPYAALSKGEQLKASLDILKTLQTAYGVEMPVFIDDAESYTSNSLVELPNQQIRLVAREGVRKLKITVEETEKFYEELTA